MELEDLMSLSLAEDRQTFQARLVGLAQSMNFSLFSAAVAVEVPGGRPRFEMIGNGPQAFAQSGSVETIARDPVLHHLKRSSLPISYDQSTYIAAGAADLYEEQAAHGFRTGLSVALHLSGGRHFLFGVDREEALPDDCTQLLAMMGKLQLVAVYAHEAALRLMAGDSPQSRAVKLTAREREVLQWTRAGKSAWAVGQILGMSEATVNFHLRNVMGKLDVSSKLLAVQRADSLGLL